VAFGQILECLAPAQT